jgi:hypothetical protein
MLSYSLTQNAVEDLRAHSVRRDLSARRGERVNGQILNVV